MMLRTPLVQVTAGHAAHTAEMRNHSWAVVMAMVMVTVVAVVGTIWPPWPLACC